MKRIVPLVITLSLMMSCRNPNQDNITISRDEYNQLKGIPMAPAPEYPKTVVIPTKRFMNGNPFTLEIEKIDECEYVSWCLGNQYGLLTHKGNCKFCQHRLEETIRKIIREEQTKK